MDQIQNSFLLFFLPKPLLQGWWASNYYLNFKFLLNQILNSFFLFFPSTLLLKVWGICRTSNYFLNFRFKCCFVFPFEYYSMIFPLVNWYWYHVQCMDWFICTHFLLFEEEYHFLFKNNFFKEFLILINQASHNCLNVNL